MSWEAERMGKVKNPGPNDLALVCPWKGALHDSALLNILMEGWSNGVLEKIPTPILSPMSNLE